MDKEVKETEISSAMSSLSEAIELLGLSLESVEKHIDSILRTSSPDKIDKLSNTALDFVYSSPLATKIGNYVTVLRKFKYNVDDFNNRIEL